ncbi:dolichyl-phosphate-mannose-protein mannosyltransferase protein [Candidatus Omnitrophus magneticus]|uniref:Dolichyl-phosphate-mannose-protein mannosyltransferase protein n=1 Tax=Candidatus Omnitrophus magneticus TaxID=1609969 RepID=A0A0F0CPA2_9BACT|nr:dolichyl-phosphate-mannose-protein mannosyltransferase protein [Candidatus Omnitrophus magneticus]
MTYILSIITFLFFIIFLAGLGKKILSYFIKDFHSSAEEFAFSYAVGFGIFGYSILFLGILGGLFPLSVILVVTTAVFLSWNEIKIIVTNIYFFTRAFGKKLPRYLSKTLFLNLIICIAGISIIACFLGSMAPSYSNDSMVYHLTDAKYFAETGKIGLIANNSTNALWPYLIEMYFTIAILLKLLPLAGLFHFSMALATLCGIYGFSKRFFREECARLSSCIFFLTPLVIIESGQTYVDLGVSLYGSLGIFSFIIWFQNKDIKWAFIAGIMSGLAMSVKYFAMIIPLIIGIYIFTGIFFAKKNTRIKIFKSFLIFITGTFLFSAVWYLRQYLIFKNPFFPFFVDIFGSSGLDTETLKQFSEKGIRDAMGAGAGLKDLILLPWRITMFPYKFGGEELGPLFLSILPAVLFLKKIEKNVKIISGIIFVYICLWFSQYQHLRFIIPIVPLLCVIAGYLLDKIINEDTASQCGINGKLIKISNDAGIEPRQDGNPNLASSIVTRTSRKKFFSNTIIKFLICAEFIYLCLFCVRHNWSAIKTVIGIETIDEYLSNNERSFEIAKYINKNFSKHDKILVIDEGHTFFIDIPNKREEYYWLYTGYNKKYQTAKDIISYFKKEGFTHILYTVSPDIGSLSELFNKNRLAILMKGSEFKEKYFKFIFEITPTSKNSNGVKYFLYAFI